MLHGRFQDVIRTNLRVSQKQTFLRCCPERPPLSSRPLVAPLVPLSPRRTRPPRSNQAVWQPRGAAVAGSRRSGRDHWSRPGHTGQHLWMLPSRKGRMRELNCTFPGVGATTRLGWANGMTSSEDGRGVV